MAESNSKIRIVIAVNSKQTIKAIVLLSGPSSEWASTISSTAKNKLKIKKPARFFVKQTSNSDFVLEVSEDSDFTQLVQDAIVFVSAGEDYVGKEPVAKFNDPSEESSSADSSKITPTVRFIHQDALVDPGAMAQLERTASTLRGLVFCCGMPDLHIGNSIPVGAAFAVRNRIYPSLIGGDIGCGMTMYRLDSLQVNDVIGNEFKIADRLRSLEGSWNGHTDNWLAEAGLSSQVVPSEFNSSLGTIGRGNHFAEIQVIETIQEKNLFETSGFSEQYAYLLVHSGSRGLGKAILEEYQSRGAKDGFDEGSPIFEEYMRQHDNACIWARRNRELIAQRVFDALNLPTSHQTKLIDIWHNNVEHKSLVDGSQVYLHRKGAAPSDKGIIVVPGSRGTLTYLVQPIAKASLQEMNAYSVAHGAGRELSRNKASSKLQSKFSSKKQLLDTLSRTSFGGVVICEDLELLCEEAPEAYKNVDAVVQDLVSSGIVKILATLKPLITYKMREE